MDVAPNTPQDEHEEIHTHRAIRAPETSAALVLRALAWATLWFNTAVNVSMWVAPDWPAWSGAAVLASLAVLQVVYSHRRRAR